jgi:rfaE bifunctional protein kinase chain/domain
MLISDLVNQFKSQSILVSGDTYIDREIYGEVLRLAPEAPVPVVRVKSKRFVPGGAANVAKNIALLGGNVFLYGDFGVDQVDREILERLQLDNIQIPSSTRVAASRLPERYRIFAANQQLIQILRKPARETSATALQPLSEFIAACPSPIQALVIYDQGYGFVTERLLQAVAALMELYPLKVIIDGHPEHVQWYQRADLYTFNADESLAAANRLGQSATTVERAGEVLREKLNTDVLVTQGGEGMTLFQAVARPVKISANRVPIADRAGAGDSVTAVLALCLASGSTLRSAAELANKAAGIVVAKPGIAYLEPSELLNLFHQEISHLLLESVGVKQRLIHEQLPAIESVVKTIIRAYRDGKTVYAFGNGGSAADANHFITELVGRFLIERKGLPALSFSTNEILMTSIANDYGYENTFSRQVDAFVKEGDLVVAFSTSGKSRNVIKALHLAKSKGATTVGFTGNSAGDFPGLCDICIRVPSDSAPRIQESHLAVVHIICELLEKELTVANPKVL